MRVRNAWLVMLAAAMTACGSASLGPAAAVSSPSISVPLTSHATPTSAPPSIYQPPPASASRVNAPAPPASGPRTLPWLPPNFCRLPFSEITEARGGFIIYPTGKRVDDPNSEVALPGNQPGAIGQNPGLTYDFPYNTWVPVPYKWLGPDGQVYVYQWNFAIKGVTVATGEAGDVTTSGSGCCWASATTGFTSLSSMVTANP